MRLRVRGPSGVVNLTLDDTATVQDLRSTISEKTSLPAFELKSGFPPKPLDLTQFDGTVELKDTGLKLDGEQLIAVPSDIQSKLSHPISKPAEPTVPLSASKPAPSTFPTPSSTSGTNSQEPRPSPPPAPSKPLNLMRKHNPFDASTGSDPPEIPVPTHSGVLILRVMPDDNSCLFRALGTALLGDALDSMHELRSVVAQGIQANPDLYSAAVLQKEPDAYCQWIQREDSWGGGIEIGLIAQTFGVEVASINVQDLRVDRFNEGQGRQRVILVYSGIHYDTIALSPDGCMVPELDIKQFDSGDDIVVEKARELCAKLQESHYYTDTAGFDLKCNICGWVGKGEKGATQHAAETGHMNFGES